MINLRILVVEDKINNVIAALIGLKELGEVKVASNLEDGIKLLDEFEPQIAIIDKNFPRKQGGEPEDIGLELVTELEKRNVLHVILTAGDHHGEPSVNIIFADNAKPLPRGLLKDHPDAWTQTFNKLKESTLGFEEILSAKERFKKSIRNDRH